jgi:PEP-CTERM motif
VKTGFRLFVATLATLAAVPASALLVTPVEGFVRSRTQASIAIFDAEGAIFSDLAMSFQNDAVASNAELDFNSVFSIGPSGILAVHTSANWANPGRGTIDSTFSYDLQSNGFSFPASVTANSNWIYIFETGPSRSVLSGSWNLSGDIAKLGSLSLYDNGNGIGLNLLTPGTFSVPLAANTRYGLTTDLGFSDSSPTGLDGVARATSHIEWSINAVPEPASWAMLIAGFGLTGASLRCRRALLGTAMG